MAKRFEKVVTFKITWRKGNELGAGIILALLTCAGNYINQQRALQVFLWVHECFCSRNRNAECHKTSLASFFRPNAYPWGCNFYSPQSSSVITKRSRLPYYEHEQATFVHPIYHILKGWLDLGPWTLDLPPPHPSPPQKKNYSGPLNRLPPEQNSPTHPSVAKFRG